MHRKIHRQTYSSNKAKQRKVNTNITTTVSITVNCVVNAGINIVWIMQVHLVHSQWKNKEINHYISITIGQTPSAEEDRVMIESSRTATNGHPQL